MTNLSGIHAVLQALQGRRADPTTPGSWNRYDYVQNDPLNAVDALGLFLGPTGQQPPPTPVVFDPTIDGNTGPKGDYPDRGGRGGSQKGAQAKLNLSQKGQVCEAKVQSAVNAALNASTTFIQPQMGGHQDDPRDPGLINGAYNFIFFVPGVKFGAGGSQAVPTGNCGRFTGSGLHIPVNGGGCNPSGDPNSPFGFNAQQNGSYFTAHLDSANPYDDLFSFFRHLINDLILRRPHGC